MRMIEKLAWNTFKNTGDIHTFLEMKQVEQIHLQTDNTESTIMGENNGTNQNEGNHISRE